MPEERQTHLNGEPMDPEEAEQREQMAREIRQDRSRWQRHSPFPEESLKQTNEKRPDRE